MNGMTLWEIIEERARMSPDRIFVRDEQDRALTFQQFSERAVCYAMWLKNHGISRGTRVAWQLPTSLESLLLASGLCRLGAVQVPLLPFLRQKEVGFICDQSQVQWLVVPAEWNGFDYAGMATGLSENNTQLSCLVLSADAQVPAKESTDIALEAYARHNPAREISWIFYTSGTTAAPKGALHCDEAIVSTAMGMSMVLELSSRDVIPMVFPFTHIGGFIWLAAHFISGAESLVMSRFSETMFPLMAERGVTVAGAGPAFVHSYLNAQRNQPQQPLFPNLRCTTGGGAAKPPLLHEQAQRELDCLGMVSGYGLTECPIATMNTVHDPDTMLATTEGRALPGMLLKIADASGNRLLPGEAGEICLKGPHLCKGYVDARLDAQAFDDEGYLRSGDIGFVNEDGWLTVTGRLKDVIIRKGENLSAKKIEDAIILHESVEDITVIGLPDDLRGELACAVIQMTDIKHKLSLQELSAFCLQEGLLRQEVPERLEFVDAIPRNASGKVMKEQLKQRFG